MLKKISLLAIILSVIISISVFASVPKQINFQGRLLNKSTGIPITGQQQMTFMIYDAETSGNLLWSEINKNVTLDAQGVYSTILGTDTTLNIDFSQPLWLQVSYNSELLIPRQKLAAVPYSMYAITAESLSGSGGSSYVLKAGDTMTGALTINGNHMVISPEADVSKALEIKPWANSAFANQYGIYVAAPSSGSNPAIFGGHFQGGSSLTADIIYKNFDGANQWAGRFSDGTKNAYFATGGAVGNWAGYFDGGNVYVNGSIEVAGSGHGIKFPDGSTQTTAAGGSNYVLKAGDKMTGTLTIEGSHLVVSPETNVSEAIRIKPWGSTVAGTGYGLYVDAPAGFFGGGNNRPTHGIYAATPNVSADLAYDYVAGSGTAYAGYFTDSTRAVYLCPLKTGPSSLPYAATFSGGNVYMSGKVGIGTNSSAYTPTYALHVYDSFGVSTSEVYLPNLSAAITTALYIDGTGKVTKGTSSKRYKHDITDFEYDGNKLSQLRPVRFKWNSTNKDDFGLIAEDVYKIYPEIVPLNLNGSPESVDYARVSVVLLKAVQEQQKEIELLKEEVKALKEKK